MHMTDARVGPAERGYQSGIVQPGPPQLIEPERDVDGCRLRLAMHSGQVGELLLGCFGELAHTAFHEIPRERGLRQHQQGRWLGRRPEPAEQFAQARQVVGVGPFTGLELGNRDAEHAEK
jgi:hypothetical protein